MWLLRFHVLATVVATQFAALVYDRRVPYYPIEVSRAAASGSAALATFRTGMLTAGGTMMLSNATTPLITAAWLSIVAIALFDDVNYWWAHMGGVAAMFAVVAVRVWQASAPWQMGVVAAAAALIYAVRIVLKAVVIVEDELDSGARRAFLRGDWTTWRRVFDKSRDIMYRGPRACRAGTRTLLVFRVCGVLQWAAWLMAGSVF